MDFLFASFLFLFYFSIGCAFVANPNSTTTLPTNNDYCQVKEMFEAIAVEPTTIPEPATISEPKTTPKTLPLLAPLSEIITLPINVEQIKLVQARKMAKILGIKQKVNGKAMPLAWLRIQIKAALIVAQPEKLKLLKEILAA